MVDGVLLTDRGGQLGFMGGAMESMLFYGNLERFGGSLTCKLSASRNILLNKVLCGVFIEKCFVC